MHGCRIPVPFIVDASFIFGNGCQAMIVCKVVINAINSKLSTNFLDFKFKFLIYFHINSNAFDYIL